MNKRELLMSVLGDELWGGGAWLNNNYWKHGVNDSFIVFVGDSGRVGVIDSRLGHYDGDVYFGLGDPDLISKVRTEVEGRLTNE
jgi:hypothetical protein